METRRIHRSVLRDLAAGAIVLFALFPAVGQDTNSSATKAVQNPNPPEMATQERQPSFQLRVERIDDCFRGGRQIVCRCRIRSLIV